MDDSQSRRDRSSSPSGTSMPRTKRIRPNNDPYYVDSEDDGDFSCSENGDTTWKPSESDLEDYEQSAVSNQLSDYRPSETSMEHVNDSHDEQSNIAVIDNNNIIEIDENEQAVNIQANGESYQVMIL